MLEVYKKQFKRKKEAVKILSDRREICAKTPLGEREYRCRTEQMWERQYGLCSICGLPMSKEEATYEHSEGRGMNGGHRDDRIEIDGKPSNSAAHGMCNVKKGSVRVSRQLEVA